MFYTIFATLSALIGAYSQTSSLSHDFNNLCVMESSDMIFSDDEQVDDYPYTSKLGSSVYFDNPALQDIIKDVNGNYHGLRYYISNSPQNNSYLAYVDFYCEQIDATQSHLVTYYLPTLKITLSDNFNFQLDFKWSFYNADFPSVPITYSRNIDFSTESTRVIYLQVERSQLLSSQYANITFDLILNGVAMNQDQFNAVTNAQENGYDEGYTNGYDDGNSAGYQTGYNDGYNEGATQDETAVVIFTGILNVGLLPVNVFLQILNFEVFGINIGGLVSAILTIAIVLIVIRIIFQGGSKGD